MVVVGSQKQATKVQIKPTPAAPEFNESFTFLLTQQKEHEIKFQLHVMHKNTFTSDVQIGSVTIDHSVLRVGRELEDEFNVRCESEHGYPIVGAIKLKMRLDPKV